MSTKTFRGRSLRAGSLAHRGGVTPVQPPAHAKSWLQTNRRLVAVFGTVVAVIAGGCNEGGQSDDAVEQRSAALATPRTISLPFPAGASRDAVVIGANGSLRLSDRVQTRRLDGSPAPVSNAGNTTTNIGADASIGTLTSIASVTLRERARVDGNLATSGTLIRQNGTTVTGSITQNAVLTPLNVFSWTVFWPDQNAGDVTVPSSAVRDLSARAYEDVVVRTGGELRLSGGIYHLGSLIAEPGSRLVVDRSQAPVVVYVSGTLIYRGQTVSGGGPEGDFLITFLGPGNVVIEQPFTGTIVAPEASVTLAATAAGSRGSFFARDVEIQPAMLVAVPFDWTRLIQPPAPTGGLATEPVNPPRIPAGPFGTKLTPTSFPRAFARTPYTAVIPSLGVGSSHAGSETPPPEPMGVTSPGYVDNIGWAFTHEALDYLTPEGAVGGESTPGKLVGLSLKRLYKPAFASVVSSFGIGMFSNFDNKLRIVANGSGGFNILSFQTGNDLGEVSWTELDADAGDNQVNGVFHTSSGIGQSIVLFTSANAVTADPAAAATAVLTEWNGNRTVFEIINTGVDVRSGRLLTLADPNGNTVSVAYRFAASATLTQLGNDRTRLWQLSSITDHFGLVGTVEYAAAKVNNRWVVSAFRAPNGTSITYTYNGGQVLGGLVGPALSRVNLPDGSVSTFSTSVEASTNLAIVRINDRAAAPGFMVRDVYLSQAQMRTAGGSLVSQQPNLVRQILNGAGEITYANWDDAARAGTTYVYEGGGALTRIQLTNNAPAAFARASFFDPNQPPAQATFEAVETYQTDDLGRLIAKTDAAARRTAWDRDRLSLAVKGVLFADGSQQTRTFGNFLRLGSLVDRNGIVDQFSYDVRGNLLSAVVAAGEIIEARSAFSVNARGRTTRTTDARGNVTDYVYDSRGFLLSITEPPDQAGGARAVTRYEYDTSGRMTATIDPDGRRKSFAYDARNRVVRITHPDASTETFTFGTAGATAGLMVSSKDRNGNVSDMSYDAATRLTQGRQGVGTAAQVVSLKTYLSGTIHPASETKRGERTDFAYDSKGRVVATTVHPAAARSLTTRAFYDALSRPTTVTDAYGRRSFFFYDADNRVLRIVKELVVGGVSGDPFSLTRNTAPNPPYAIEDHTFSTVGDEVLTVDPMGTATRSEFDNLRRLVRKVEASGTSLSAVWSYRYDVAGNLIRLQHPRAAAEEINSATNYIYNGRNLLASVTAAPGSTTQASMSITYTRTKQKAQVTDARGGVTRYTYSTCCDRLETVVEPTGATTRFVYDANGNRITLTDANGIVERSSYDALNRPTSVVNGAGETKTIAYDDNLTDGAGLDSQLNLSGLGLGAGADGSAVAVTDALGARRFLVKDGVGRSVLERDQTGNVSRYGYDAIVAGLVESTRTDPLGNVTRNQTDAAGKARAIIDAEGKAAIKAFDAAGRLVLAGDATGTGRECTVDARGRTTSCFDTAGDRISMTYDTEGNTRTTVDGLGRTSSCTYDQLNRPSICRDRLGFERRFQYDAASNVVAVTDAEGKVTRYTYDPRGLRTEDRFPDGSVIKNEFDAGGRLAATTAADGVRATMTYDGANRMTRRDYPDGQPDTFTYDTASHLVRAQSGRYQNTVNRSYDPAGRLLTDSLTVGGATRTVTNSYDAAGRRTAIRYPDGTTVATAYTARDLVSAVSFGSFTLARYTHDNAGRVLTNTLGNGKVETYTYRGDGLLASISIPTVSALSYQYNATKHVTRELRNNQPYDDFSYDAEQRLTDWTRGGLSNRWALSAEGNFNTVFVNNAATETRTHNAAHAVTAINGGALTYDARGRLLSDRNGRSYVWNIDGNINTISRSSGERADFTFDALGRRVTRRVGAVTTAFVHDQSEVVAEYDNGTLARSYVLGIEIDQPIAMRVGNVHYFYARQVNKSIHALVQDNGTVVERYEYDPHGLRTIRAADGSVRTTSAVGNAYGYTGRYHDAAVGIIDFRARQYSPELGRFISRDSAYLDGLSLYRAYFAPDASDPSGHWSLNPLKALKKVVDVVEDVGEAVVDAGGAVVNAVGDVVDAATDVATDAVDTVADAATAAVTGVGRVVGSVVGNAFEASTTLGTALAQGINRTVRTAVQAGAWVATAAGRLGATVVDATVDSAIWLGQRTAEAAETVGGAIVAVGEWTGKAGYNIGKWTVENTYNVGRGFVLEAYNMTKRTLEETWDLAKAAGTLGAWMIATPIYLMVDPEGWAKTGASAGLDLLKATASFASFTALELAPTIYGAANSLGPLTALGLTIGLVGWIAGGDAPTLNWMGGGLVFEFGNSPLTFGPFSRTYGRAIVYHGNPEDSRAHEYQHILQYNLLGDVGYTIGHLTSIGISYVATGNYSDANLLERGPYAIGGPQRPWPWNL
jgi:RHS repeat-associated protein